MKTCILIILLFMSHNLFAQKDSTELNNFLAVQSANEAKFISFAKTNKIDSCLAMMSPEIIKKIGHKKLIASLEKINSFFAKYDTAGRYFEISRSVQNGVGWYGHNVQGTRETESVYDFR